MARSYADRTASPTSNESEPGPERPGEEGGGRGQMARTISESAPMTELEEASAKSKKAASSAAAAGAIPHRTLAGPYGASFDGTDGKGHPVKGLTFERRWTTP